MSYLVLARKYRPQSFDQVVKQDHVTRTLANAIAADRVAHAILFSGPRGTGKTTVARILAKAMNCKAGPVAKPCNTCESCLEITSGRAVDVFEIDGASNNSVDQIRELRENVKYMPAHSRYKIYIIDEVHMLSVAAFNALLKTLEEPPAHVLFVFATTEPQKIPITILSRCQRHDFKLIDIESICGHMQMIGRQEGFDLEEQSLVLIAREGKGSMRDALSLLDQVMSCFSGTATHQQILDLLGVIDRKIIYDISTALLSGDIPNILDILDEVYNSGHNMLKLYADLVEHIRNLLVVKMGKNVRKLVDAPAHEIAMMVEQVKDVSGFNLNLYFDLLFKEEAIVAQTSNPKLAIEMVFMRLFQIKPALPIEMLIEKLDHLRKDIYGSGKADHDTDPETGFGGRENDSQASSNVSPGTAESVMPYEQDTAETRNDNEKIWQELYQVFSEKHPLLAANLRNSTLKKVARENLEIEVNGNGFDFNMIRREKNLAIIKKVCSDYFGREMEVSITTKKDSHNSEQIKKKQAGRLKNEALGHPLVTDAIEVFDGRVKDVKIL